MYTTFHSTEIQLDSIVRPEDWDNEELTLRRGTEGKLNEWQVETALGTWKAMQQSESEKLLHVGFRIALIRRSLDAGDVAGLVGSLGFCT